MLVESHKQLAAEVSQLNGEIETLKADAARKRDQVGELDREIEKRRQTGVALESKYAKLQRTEELDRKIQEQEMRYARVTQIGKVF
jgi:chromosome segregation ATPase